MNDRLIPQTAAERNQSDSCPRAVRLARSLFYVNAATWLGLAVVSLLRLSGRSGPALTPLIVATLMAGNAAAMALAGILLGRPRKHWYLAALALLAVNILLTFTDQFGLLDFLTLIVDLAAAGLLLSGRARAYFFG